MKLSVLPRPQGKGVELFTQEPRLPHIEADLTIDITECSLP
jgi:hypothetical protein